MLSCASCHGPPLFGSGSHPGGHPEAVGIVVDLQPGGGQLHVQAIQHHHHQQHFDVPGQIGQQQLNRRGRPLGIIVGKAVELRALQLFQIRKTLQTPHLDVGRGGSRHRPLTATLQLGDGAEQTPPHAELVPRHFNSINPPLRYLDSPA